MQIALKDGQADCFYFQSSESIYLTNAGETQHLKTLISYGTSLKREKRPIFSVILLKNYSI